jgi:hypothetical protein
MQILYAAPFIALALVTFIFCVVIPRTRSFAFPISGGVLAFGIGALLGFLLMIFITDWMIHAKHTATFWFAISFSFGGVISSLFAFFGIRFVLSRLSKNILRWSVAIGCLGHLLALTVITLSGCLYPFRPTLSDRTLAILFATLPVVVSVYLTIFLTRRSEEFRPLGSLHRRKERAEPNNSPKLDEQRDI